jgi:Domain of unknown function (DUF4160)
MDPSFRVGGFRSCIVSWESWDKLCNLMPTISVFYGIVIQMFWRDHTPAHFHALYAEHEALIDLSDFRVIRGSLPRRAMALVLEWAADHREELMEDWNLCRRMQTPKPIEPLK